MKLQSSSFQYRDDDQIIEDVEPIDENVVIENEQKSLEAVPNESNVEDSDDGFPKIKPMRRRKLKTKESKYEIGKEFQPQAKTTLQVYFILNHTNLQLVLLSRSIYIYIYILGCFYCDYYIFTLISKYCGKYF